MKAKHGYIAFFIVCFVVVLWSFYVIVELSHDCEKRGGYPIITRTDVICLDKDNLK